MRNSADRALFYADHFLIRGHIGKAISVTLWIQYIIRPHESVRIVGYIIRQRSGNLVVAHLNTIFNPPMTSVQPYLMIVNTCISITFYLDTVPLLVLHIYRRDLAGKIFIIGYNHVKLLAIIQITTQSRQIGECGQQWIVLYEKLPHFR